MKEQSVTENNQEQTGQLLLSESERDCLNCIIDHIEQLTKPSHSVLTNVYARLPISELHFAWRAAGVPAPHQTDAILNENDYRKWAYQLLELYRWTERVSRNSESQAMLLPDLLASGRRKWVSQKKQIAQTKIEDKTQFVRPTPKKLSVSYRNALEAEAFAHIAATINKTKAAFGERRMEPLDLFHAAIMADVTGVESATHSLLTSKYHAWATVLTMNYGYCERAGDPLHKVLEFAVNSWRHRPKSPSILDTKETPVKPVHRKQEQPTRSNVSVKSTFSEILIEDDASTHLQDASSVVYRRCNFCLKESVVSPRTKRIIQRLAGDNNFFCPFCVRHDMNTRKRNHVMILSLRAMIAYLFHSSYFGKQPMLFLSQIDDLIAQHVIVGQQNPVFLYDPETYCWFVNFAKVGQSKRRVAVREVICTVNEMISAFNPYNYIREFKSHKYAEKFREAIIDFYERRYRPADKLLCVPTLVGCASDLRDGGSTTTTNKKMDLASHRNFLPSSFKLSSRR